MRKLKPRRISLDRLLFILPTINTNVKVDVGFSNYSKDEFEISAVIGVSVYMVWEPYNDKTTKDILKQITTSLSHLSNKYSIHQL